MPSAATKITDFVLDRMQDESVQKRIELTRALAEIAATPAERASLTSLADELAAVDQHHRQLLLNFRAKHA